MGWIKRNLIFLAGAVLALVLLGGAGYYIYLGWSRNSEQSQQLNDRYAKLTELNNSPQQAGDSKTDNLKAAREQDQQLRDWITKAGGYFQPVLPIPRGEVTSKTYASALGTTVYQLQQEAKENKVDLPANYYFSFQVQSDKLTISSGLNPLAKQLGEVKAIVEILFAAGVNNLDSIQRVRVSDDDVSSGAQSDYTDKTAITNDLAIITPYLATFQCFTPELAKVISGFATSTNPFIVKSVSVQPSNPSGTPDSQAMNVNAPPPPPQYGPGRFGGGRYGPYPGGLPQQPPPANVPPKTGLQTVLKEQLLRITVEVDIVQLLPKR